jgi:Protein of unknown function (DUF2752)
VSAHIANFETRPGRFFAQPGRVPGLCGALLGAQLFVLRVIASADADSVTFAGRALHWGCWFRQHFGVPCPLCGMTRSTLVTLHGQFNLAWALNWAGPVFVIGLLLLALALLGVMLCAQIPPARAFVPPLQRGLRFGGTIYAGLSVIVLIAHWLFALRTL